MTTTNIPIAIPVSNSDLENQNLPIAYPSLGEGIEIRSSRQDIPVSRLQTILEGIENNDDLDDSLDGEPPPPYPYSISQDRQIAIPMEMGRDRSRDRNIRPELFNSEQILVTPQMIKLWNLSKTIKYLSIFDALFCLWYLQINPILLIFVIFPLIGYLGAKYFQPCHLTVYVLYSIINLVIKINQYIHTTIIGTRFFLVMSTVLEVVILYVLLKFISRLKKLPILELLTIQSPVWHPYHINSDSDNPEV